MNVTRRLLPFVPMLTLSVLGSTLRGTVTDKSGTLVAGAGISAREVSTNIVARTVTTNAEESYELPGGSSWRDCTKTKRQ